MIGHGVQHLAIGLGEPVVVLKEIDVAVNVSHHGFLINKAVGFHQIGIRGVGVNHHFVNLLKPPLVSLLKLIVLHAEAPVGITNRETSQRGERVDLIAVDHFKNRLKRIEPIVFGEFADLIPHFRKLRWKRTGSKTAITSNHCRCCRIFCSCRGHYRPFPKKSLID